MERFWCIVRSCIYFLLGMFVVFAMVLFGLHMYLTQNGAEISKKIEREIATRTNLQVRFSAIELDYFPLPTIALRDVTVEEEHLQLRVANLRVAPSLWHALQGKFNLGYAHLTQPQVHITIASTEKEDTKKQTSPAKASTSAKVNTSVKVVEQLRSFMASPVLPLPSLLHGANVQIVDGSLLLEKGKEKIIVDTFRATITVGITGTVESAFELNNTEIQEEQKVLVSVPLLKVALHGLGNVENPLYLLGQPKAQKLFLHVESLFTLPHVLHNMHIVFDTNIDPQALASTYEVQESFDPKKEFMDALAVKKGAKEKHTTKKHVLEGMLSVTGDILWEEAPIAVKVRGLLQGGFTESAEKSLDMGMVLRNFAINLDKDSLILNGALSQIIHNPTLEGHIDLTKMSLIQWFGFARNFPPGLQKTLDYISGELEFSMDGIGLKVPRITATTAESTFTGSGGVKQWKNTVIDLYLTTPHLLLRRAYPEAEGIKAKAPEYHHGPLTPVPGTPEAINSTGPSVSYNINIGAKAVTAWELTLEELHMRVIPIENEKRYAKGAYKYGVLLGFDLGKVYGGKANADVILYRTPKDESGYAIFGAIENMRAEKPLARLLGREMVGGNLFAKTAFTATGKGIGEFLITKKGTASLRIENGFFANQKKVQWHFDSVKVDGDFQAKNKVKVTGDTLPPSLRYEGVWKGALVSKDVNITSNLTGPLEFAGKDYGNVIIDAMKSNNHVVVHTESTTLPHEIQAKLDASLHLETRKDSFAIKEAKGILTNYNNATIKGALDVHFSKELLWDADVSVVTNNASEFVKKLQTSKTSPLPPTAPQNLAFAATVHEEKDAFRIDNIVLQLGEMSAKGSMRKILTPKPVWNIHFHADTLAWRTLFPEETKKIPAPNGANVASTPTPVPPVKKEKDWDFSWMDDREIHGVLRIDSFSLKEEYAKNVYIPLKLKDKVLECSPTTFDFFGSKASMHLRAEHDYNTLQVQGGFEAQNVDLAALSRGLKLKSFMGGQGSLWASMQGGVKNYADIPAKLDGSWRLQMQRSFLQSLKSDGSADGKPTTIELLTASGTLTKGVLHSKNFVLKGPELNLTGGGKIDLVHDTLAINLLANMGTLQGIPVTFSGSLDNPERKVDTGAVIMSAIGSLGSGVLGVIGGFFNAVFSLF